MVLNAKELYQIAHKYNEEYVNSFKRTYLEKYLDDTNAENILLSAAQTGKYQCTLYFNAETAKTFNRNLKMDVSLIEQYFKDLGYDTFVEEGMGSTPDRTYYKLVLFWTKGRSNE